MKHLQTANVSLAVRFRCNGQPRGKAKFNEWSVLNGPESRFRLTFIAGESEDGKMNRKGIDFSLKQVEPDLWKWQFQIGDTVTTGQTRSRLMGIAVHRAQERIDLELRKPRNVMQ